MTETPTAPTDNELLNAQMRLEARRAQTKVSVNVKDSLEKALDRVSKLGPLLVAATDDKRERQIAELRAAAGIPSRHNILITEGDTAWNRKRQEIVARLGNGFLVALVGVQGTGKTQMGSALIYAATQKLLPCKFAVAMDFFIDLKASFDGKANEAQVIQSYVKPKLLVLDECDERSESAWENRLLFHMLNKRYNAMLDTLLISRRSRDDFMSSLGQSIQSRIQEVGGCIVCDWESFRA